MNAAAPQRYEAFDEIVLRTPLLPIDVYRAWSQGLRAPEALDQGGDLEVAVTEDRRKLRSRLHAHLVQPATDEALFLASPGFRRSLDKLQIESETRESRGIARSAVRYLTRMTMRSTPFGVCAGTSFGRIGDRGHLRLPLPEAYRRSARLDSAYLHDLAHALENAEACAPYIRYRPNDTLYQHEGSLRYYEPIPAERHGAVACQLVELASSDALACVLSSAAGGAPAAVLVARLQATLSVEHDEADAFVRQLIARRILVGDLTPTVVGGEPLAELAARLAEIPGLDSSRRQIERLRGGLSSLSAAPIGAAQAIYDDIARHAEVILPAQRSTPVHVDLFKPTTDLVLSRRIVDDVIDAIALLSHLDASEDPLADFRARFLARHGDQELPLLEVLDEESGIGYRPVGPRDTPLVDGLGLGRPAAAEAPTIPSRMISWLEAVWSSGELECELGPELARGLARGTNAALPPQLCALVRVEARDDEAVEAGDYRVLLSGVSCGPVSKFLGRFCHGSPEAMRIARASIAHEQARDPACARAEIVHLPTPSAGNVTCRPALRDAYIPILAPAGTGGGDCVSLADLRVRIVGDEVHLRSSSRNRRVMPAMACAADTRRSPLAAYAFLDAVGSAEYRRAFTWSWPASLDEARFLPRLRLGRVIVSRARWRLECADVSACLHAAPSRQLAEIHALRRRFRIPRRVVTKAGDRELPLDLQNSLCVDLLFQLLEREGQQFLLEDTGFETSPVHDGRHNYAHDLIIPLRAPPRVAPEPIPPPVIVPRGRVVRTFAPGSEWTYLRLFTSPRGVDRLVCEFLPELVGDDATAQAIDRWFFIRYAKSGFHLRLRVHSRCREDARDLTSQLLARTSHLPGRFDVWRVELGTYEPEVERYGGPEAITLAEEVFTADSECAMGMLRGIVLHGRSSDERWEAAAVGVDRLLADFGLTLPARRDLLVARVQELRARVGVSRSQQLAIDARFRSVRQALADALAGASRPLLECQSPLDARSRRLAPLLAAFTELERSGRSTRTSPSVLRSFIHMHVNRLLLGSHAPHELLICEFLARHYGSKIAYDRHAPKTRDGDIDPLSIRRRPDGI